MKKSVDIWLALTHPFKDPKWAQKFLLGGLVAVVPILNFAIVGYELQIAHALLHNDYHELPKWNNLGNLVTTGVKLGVARFVLALPALVLAFIEVTLFVASLPLFEVDVTKGGAEVLALILMILGMIFISAYLYSMIIALVMPVMEVNYVRYGTLSSCFDIVAAFHFIWHNFIGYVMVCLTGFVAALIWLPVMRLSIWLSIFIPPFFDFIFFFVVGSFGAVWIAMTRGHALGQLLAIDAAKTSN